MQGNASQTIARLLSLLSINCVHVRLLLMFLCTSLIKEKGTKAVPHRNEAFKELLVARVRLRFFHILQLTQFLMSELQLWARFA